MLLGGHNSAGNERTATVFDPVTRNFTDIASLIYRRQNAACAVFISPFHEYRPVVLSAGGWYQGTAELLDYTQANASWTESKA